MEEGGRARTFRFCGVSFACCARPQTDTAHIYGGWLSAGDGFGIWRVVVCTIFRFSALFAAHFGVFCDWVGKGEVCQGRQAEGQQQEEEEEKDDGCLGDNS